MLSLSTIFSEFLAKIVSEPLAKSIINTYDNKGSDYMYQRIRDLREDKDMTQTQMAEILMCSQRVYSNYERGDIDVPTQILIRLADFHGVSVDYLLGRTNNRQMNK